jgi:hypothetical protein
VERRFRIGKEKTLIDKKAWLRVNPPRKLKG